MFIAAEIASLQRELAEKNAKLAKLKVFDSDEGEEDIPVNKKLKTDSSIKSEISRGRPSTKSDLTTPKFSSKQDNDSRLEIEMDGFLDATEKMEAIIENELQTDMETEADKIIFGTTEHKQSNGDDRNYRPKNKVHRGTGRRILPQSSIRTRSKVGKQKQTVPTQIKMEAGKEVICVD